MEEHQINVDSHREHVATFQDVFYRPRTEQLNPTSNEGKSDWQQLIDTSNTKVQGKSVNYEYFHINPCTENNNCTQLEFLTCIVITDNTDTRVQTGLQDT